MVFNNNTFVAVFSLTSLSFAAVAQTTTYPSKPVRIVVPWAAGGGADIITRSIGQKLNESTSQQIVIDNRPGAATIIGTEIVAKSAPDGYTLLLGTSPLTINASLYKKLPYDTMRDFAPVMLMASAPHILVASPKFSANSVKELVDLAKSKPGGINYASGGNGSAAHLAAELFKTAAGINMVHIPFKGAAP
jgi:tripartite-type tricarboxylate transporter receptor subunit TctC